MKLTIVEERNIFNEALYFLNALRLDNEVTNPDILDYINQMLNNEKEYIKSIHVEDGSRDLVIVDLEFKDMLQVQVICAFWTAVCAETMDEHSELYEVAKNMYYGLVLAMEEVVEEGGAL